MILPPTLAGIKRAAQRLKGVATRTPLAYNANLSARYKANIYLKREDLQVVRSYKIRGAYNQISSLSAKQLSAGVVCASAGNHAQGVAYACAQLKTKGIIFMPTTTPLQKVRQAKMFGQDQVEVRLTGDTFDDAYQEAVSFCDEQGSVFVHPFENTLVMEGQGTVGLEILEEGPTNIDFLLFAIGGGGLASGVSTYFKEKSPATKLIGVEPKGAANMSAAFEAGHVVTLEKINKFVDGAAVKRAGERTYATCKNNLDRILTVPEGKACSTILSLYNEEAIIAEPAGVLSISALDEIADELVGKNIVCIIGGGNNDITRTEEIKERSLIYEGLKHYFIINFSQRSGALKEFLEQVLGPKDDIVFFEYSKKTARERGPAMVGLEIAQPEDFDGLVERMKLAGFSYTYINDKPELFAYLI